MDQTITSNRKSIFNRNTSRGKLDNRKFQSYSKSFLLSLFDKFDDCGCINSVKICPYVYSIINKQCQEHCQQRYLQLKKAAFDQNNKHIDDDYRIVLTGDDKIFTPHINNLLKLVQPLSIEPLLQILRHAKTQYATFWIYAKLCEKWPPRHSFISNIKNIANRNKMAIDFESIQIQTKIDKLYETKLANISENNYLKVVKLCVRQELFCEKMAALYLIQGRQRSANQIINATIDHDDQF